MSSHDTLAFLEVGLYLYQTDLQSYLGLALPVAPCGPMWSLRPLVSLALPEVPEDPESLALPEVPESQTHPEVPVVPVDPPVLVVPEVPGVPALLPHQVVAEWVVGYQPALLPEQSAASCCHIPWCRKGTRQIQSLALLDLVQGP